MYIYIYVYNYIYNYVIYIIYMSLSKMGDIPPQKIELGTLFLGVRFRYPIVTQNKKGYVSEVSDTPR